MLKNFKVTGRFLKFLAINFVPVAPKLLNLHI